MKKLLLAILLVASSIMPAAALAEGIVGAPREVTDTRQAFITGSIVVKGEGAGPADTRIQASQRRLMTIRAATVDAYRRLTEAIEGVAVSGETLVRDAALQSEAVTASVQGVVRGAEILSETYDQAADSAVVYVSIPVSGQNGLAGRVLPQLSTVPGMQPPRYYAPAGADLAAAGRGYDGLIVDATGQPFRPALINRVVARNGQTLYDPASPAVGKAGGAGPAYTDGVEKAVRLLGERGSRNPMVVKAAGLDKSTDVIVGPEDAAAIFASNQANNFLEGSRVVFVLK